LLWVPCSRSGTVGGWKRRIYSFLADPFNARSQRAFLILDNSMMFFRQN